MQRARCRGPPAAAASPAEVSILDCELSNAHVSFGFYFQCLCGSDNEQFLMFVDWLNEFLLHWLLNVSYVRAQLLSHVRLFSTQPYGLQPARLLCSWDSPGKNTGVGCHFLLQGIFLTQGWNQRLLHLLHLQVDSLPLSHLGSPFWLLPIAYFSTVLFFYLSFSSWTIGILFCMFFLFLPTQYHLLVEVKKNQKRGPQGVFLSRILRWVISLDVTNSFVVWKRLIKFNKLLNLLERNGSLDKSICVSPQRIAGTFIWWFGRDFF